jgi:hypothetical protein
MILLQEPVFFWCLHDSDRALGAGRLALMFFKIKPVAYPSLKLDP